MRNFTFDKLYPRFDTGSADESADMTTANNSINSATANGNTAINSFDPTATAASQNNNSNSNFNISQGEAGTIGNQLQSVINSNPTVTSLYNTANSMFNVPALQTTATNLNNQVTNAVPDAYNAARGFDIDATDINNGVAAKQSYLEPQANAATANANTAEGLASNFVQAGQAQNTQNLIPAETEATTEQQNIAAQETGWNQTQANEFSALIAKMQSGVQLSTTEMQTAQSLAATEEAYNQNLATQQAQVQEANIGQQYQTLAPANELINTFKTSDNTTTNNA